MDDTIPEVIITSSKSCAIYDANDANEIVTYENEHTLAPKTLSLIGEELLIGAFLNKPILKVWTVSKKRKQEAGSFVVPGIVSALAVSNCSNYCIAGIAEKIFVWKVSSGKLLKILPRHYQSVSCLKFTADNSRFFSGGKDGLVIVWILSRAIGVSDTRDDIKPAFVWDKHSAEVTDIYCGNAVSRVATTSLDMTCKIYELDSGLLLHSICMDVPLTSVVMDLLEYFIFLGDERGYLYRIGTYEKLPPELHRANMKNKAALKLHETKIITLGVSYDGTRLMTASEDCTCKLWDMKSMTCALNIRFQGAPTNVFLKTRPSSLSDEAIPPQWHVQAFQKEMNSGTEYIESKVGRKQLSLMYDGCPDSYYGHSLFFPGKRTSIEEIDAEAVEQIFHESIHGESIKVVESLNKGMFSNFLLKQLNKRFAGPPSPT